MVKNDNDKNVIKAISNQPDVYLIIKNPTKMIEVRYVDLEGDEIIVIVVKDIRKDIVNVHMNVGMIQVDVYHTKVYVSNEVDGYIVDPMNTNQNEDDHLNIIEKLSVDDLEEELDNKVNNYHISIV